MVNQDSGNVVRELYRLFNAGKIEAASELAASDVRIDFVPFGMQFENRQGFADFMRSFKTAFPDLTISIEKQIVSNGAVVTECSWAGTHDGPLATPSGEVPATHKSVSGARFCEIYEIKDGVVRRMANYQDVASWLRQIGLA